MYLDEEQVLEPPEGGWPSITAQNLRGLGKTDEVIALLRHLPYISRPSDLIMAHGSARCVFADWQRLATSCAGAPDEAAAHLKWSSEEDFDGNVPSHVVGLTNGGNYNSIFLLDTKLGIVHWRSCPHKWRYYQVREKITDEPSEYAPENEEEWRDDAPAWAVADFFEILKERFRKLDFVPISSRNVLYAETRNREESQGVVLMVKEIYRAHGWPDLEAYRKDECLLAIRTAMEVQYPDVCLDP
jgi:hypothetical protein